MRQVHNITIDDQDMPPLFQAADRASVRAQRAFVRAMALDLSLVVLSSVIGAFSFSSESAKSLLSTLSAAFMASGLLLTIYVRSQRFEQDWYDGRAIAESIKTRTWRFMTCSKPYLEKLKEEESNKLFLKTLQEVMKERRNFSASLGADIGVEPPITQKMLAVRRMEAADRKQVYLLQRVNEQRRWYSNKSGINKWAAAFWFNAIMLAQASALLFSLLFIRFPNFPVNLAGIFATAAAAFIAWLQMKRHQELSNSYGLASQELGLIAEQSQYVNTSDELSVFVLDAENAISREHTLWIARRDIL